MLQSHRASTQTPANSFVPKEKNIATDTTISEKPIAGWYCTLLLTATILTFLLIALGGIVCITDASKGCPDWPGCYGQFIPPLRMDSILEYTHRLIAALTTLFTIIAAVVGWWKYRTVRWVSRPLLIAVVLLFVVSALGAMTVLHGLSPELATVDLGSALMVLALVLTATVVAYTRCHNPNLPDRLSFRSPFARLSLWTLVAVFAVLVSAVLVAESGSMVRCLGWPFPNLELPPMDLHDWLQAARLLLAIVAGILLVALVAQAWRTQRSQRAIQRTATAVGALFLLEVVIGLLMLASGFTIGLHVIYITAAAALWAVLVVLVVLVGEYLPIELMS